MRAWGRGRREGGRGEKSLENSRRALRVDLDFPTLGFLADGVSRGSRRNDRRSVSRGHTI